jgi:hypothetical protein
LPRPLLRSPIAEAVADDVAVGAGVFAGVLTAIAAATGGAASAVVFAAVAVLAAAASAAEVVLSVVLLPLEGAFAAGVEAAVWIWPGSSGWATSPAAAGAGCESELLGLVAALASVVAALCAGVWEMLAALLVGVAVGVSLAFAVCCGLPIVPVEALRAALPPFAAGDLVLPPVAAPRAAALEPIPLPTVGGFCGIAGAVRLLAVAVGGELAGAVEPEFWFCQAVPLAGPEDVGVADVAPAEAGAADVGAADADADTGAVDAGAAVAGSGGFADAVGVSGAVVAASSSSANGCEAVSGPVVAVGDHCDCKKDDVELTSDAILGTAKPSKGVDDALPATRGPARVIKIIIIKSKRYRYPPPAAVRQSLHQAGKFCRPFAVEARHQGRRHSRRRGGAAGRRL